MTKVTTNIDQSSSTSLIAFSALSNGDWFYSEYHGLGVKVDGKGFYPDSRVRGDGTSSLVRKVPTVQITYTAEGK